VRSSLAIQIGGDHYKGVEIQPVEFSEINQLSFCEGNVVKYLLRYSKKNGLEDIDKAKHYIQLLEDLTAKSKWGDGAGPRYGHLPIPLSKLWESWPDTHPMAKSIIEIICGWRHVEYGQPRQFRQLGLAKFLIEDLSKEVGELAIPTNACHWEPPKPNQQPDYNTGCGTTFRFPDDSPRAPEMGFKFCPNCRKPIHLKRPI